MVGRVDSTVRVNNTNQTDNAKTFMYTFPARIEEQMLVNHQRLGTEL